MPVTPPRLVQGKVPWVKRWDVPVTNQPSPYYTIKPPTERVYTNRPTYTSIAYRAFKARSDQKIAELLTLEPGESILGDPEVLFGKGFSRSFLKSLETPIVIEPDDDEETRALKAAVRETRKELKARLDAGEDIAETMRGVFKELREIGLYRDELEKQLKGIAKDKSMSEKDMEDFVTAANQMLSERGAKPLTMPRVAARRFEVLRAKRTAEAAAEADANRKQQEDKQ